LFGTKKADHIIGESFFNGCWIFPLSPTKLIYLSYTALTRSTLPVNLPTALTLNLT
jgi:hypothetical protein